MPLVVSVSGMRGVVGDGLDADTLVRYTSAFATWCRSRAKGGERPTVVVGRDGRTTGEVLANLVAATLQASGCDVVEAGMATTPTVAMAVEMAEAAGGIILSASHNPAEWNALKLLNEKGEFLTVEQAEEVLLLAERPASERAVRHVAFGSRRAEDFLAPHVDAILALPYIDAGTIAAKNFRVVVDAINSVGGVALPYLLERLGVTDVTVLNGEPTGRFAHNPEPLPAHLTDIMEKVRHSGADIGFVVDPDVDRLGLVQDGGVFFGEELTQVLAADFLLRKQPGPFVTNLSSSRAIEDMAASYGQPVYRSAVGEAHVVKVMREKGAVLGGEGNGGVILPALHYGRDALVGIAITLQHLAETGEKLSEVRERMPTYVMAKHKLVLGDQSPEPLLAAIAERYGSDPTASISTIDGVKIDLPEGWVHLRKSNTEPIVRIYSEAASADEAEALAERFKAELVGSAL